MHKSHLESVEPRTMMDGAREVGVGGALRDDSFRLIVGDSAISGQLAGPQLIIHTSPSATIGATQEDEIIRIGASTIGGTIGDPIILEMAGATIGGVLSDDGMLLRVAGNTIGGATQPDTWVLRFNTVGGTTDIEADIRVGANTVGGVLNPDANPV